MSKNNTNHEESGFESVEHALSRTEQYIEENKKSLSIIVGAIVLVVGGYMLYTKAFLAPNVITSYSIHYTKLYDLK